MLPSYNIHFFLKYSYFEPLRQEGEMNISMKYVRKYTQKYKQDY